MVAHLSPGSHSLTPDREIASCFSRLLMKASGLSLVITCARRTGGGRGGGQPVEGGERWARAEVGAQNGRGEERG